MFYFDPTMILVLPGLILALWAQARVNGAFSRYSQLSARSGLTGAEMARQLLAREGIYDVDVQRVCGNLTDHYSPNEKVLRLSDNVFYSNSIAALGVAAHECGHVLQHRDGYAPLMLRNAVVPVANIGSSLSWPLFLLGFIFSWRPLLLAGIILFSAAVFFTLITLPVEFNASRRALGVLESEGVLSPGEELDGARRVLSAAALTYVASALSAILQLLRLLVLSNRNRD